MSHLCRAPRLPGRRIVDQSQPPEVRVNQLNAWHAERNHSFNDVTQLASAVVNDPKAAHMPDVAWPVGFALPDRVKSAPSPQPQGPPQPPVVDQLHWRVTASVQQALQRGLEAKG